MKSYLDNAKEIAIYISEFIERQGLSQAAIRGYILAIQGQSAWLFAEIDTRRVRKLADYINPALLHHLSTDLEGKPVILSNSTGLRWAVMLGEAPKLPASIDAPAFVPGKLHIGRNWRGENVSLAWDELEHMLLAGITRSGKTNAMRLIATQAITDGAKLAVIDPDGRSFAFLNGNHALLIPPAVSIDDSNKVLEAVFIELNRRSELYSQAGPMVDRLDAYNATGREPLPRLLVIIEEAPSLIMAHGGKGSVFAQNLTRLGWNTLKFGVHLMIGAQDTTKEILGPVVDMCATRLCFRVQRPETSRMVVGRQGAEQIGQGQRGRALSLRWGLLQTYLASPAPLAMAAPVSPAIFQPAQMIDKIGELAEKMRPILKDNPRISKRALCKMLLGQPYGGGYAHLIDEALDRLKSDTTYRDKSIDTPASLRAEPGTV